MIRRRSRSWIRWITVLVVMALATGGFWLVYASPWTRLDQVSIGGVSQDREEQVKQALKAPMGTPLASVPMDTLRARVVELPWVAGVHLSRQWPNTLGVEVVARQPALALRSGSRTVHIIDREGVDYEEGLIVPSGVPVVSASRTFPAATYRAVIAMLAALPEDLKTQATGVTIRGEEEIEFTIGDTTIAWGGPGDAQAKAAVVAALYPHGFAEINVSAPDLPVTRPKAEATSD